MSAQEIIDKYYPEDNSLKRLLFTHSLQVCNMAMEIAQMHPELHLNLQLVHDGAMLHDIGIFLTHAPSIFCQGDEPYVMHGYLGARLMEKEGLRDVARICERHTGAGLTAQDIISQHINVPPCDYLPETAEEKLICYADKFFSKSKVNMEITYQHAYDSLLRFGQEGADRFAAMHRLFHSHQQV